MVRKAFSGDLVHELPKGKIEPYRLWFEYLKLALQIYPSRVDKAFYESWGDVEKLDFDEWFKDNWKKLFATPASVSILSDATDINDALNNPDTLVIRVSSNAPIRRQIADFTKALKALPRSKTVKFPTEPRFVITSKRSMNLAQLRAKLKLLKLFYDLQDLERSAVAYYDWATTWNEGLRGKKKPKNQIFIPSPIENLIEEIKLFEGDQKKSKRKLKKPVLYNNARSDLRRFLRKGEKVLSNVEKGIFPGEV